MPLGGETIGRAYVKILADGAGFSDDVERQLRESEPDFKAGGKKSSKEFWDGYDEENKKRHKKSLVSLRKDLERGVGRFTAVGDMIGENMSDGLHASLKKRFGDVGTVIFGNLKDQLERGQIDFTGLERSLRNIRPLVAKALDDIAKDTERMAKDQARLVVQANKAAEKSWNELGASIKRLSKGLDAGGRSRKQLTEDMLQLRRVLPDVVKNTEAFRVKQEEMRKTLARSTPDLTRLTDMVERAGNRFGKAFGKGSRNNFLNFFGGFMSILPKAITQLGRFSSAIEGFFGNIASQFKFARDAGQSGALILLETLGKSLLGAAVAVGGAIVVLGGVVQLLGPLASALVLTSGLVLALAGSLGFALVGAIVAVAGALVPFAAAFGVAMIAMTDMRRDSKKAPFKQLRKDWEDFQKSTRLALFGKNQEAFKAIRQVLLAIEPVLLGVAKAMNVMLTNMGKFTQSKSFTTAMGNLSKVLEPMVETLGRIGGNVLLGIGRAFLAAEPLITDFLGWLEKITGKFADMGKGGRDSKLADFFEKAEGSARAVWGLIKQVAKAIGELFSAGKGTGDSIFVTLTAKVKEFRKWLAGAQKDGSLKKMFDDAKLLAEKIGIIVEDVGTLITKLDTDANRTFLFALLDITDKLLDLLILVAGEVEKLQATDWNAVWDGATKRPEEAKSKIQGLFSGPGLFANLKTEWNKAFEGWDARPREAWTKVKGIFAGVGTFFAGVGRSIASTMSEGWASLSTRAGQARDGIVRAFTGLAKKAKAAGGNVVTTLSEGWTSLKTRAGQARDGIVRAFSGLATKIVRAAGNIGSAISRWFASLPGTARRTATQITNAFSGLASKIIRSAGSAAQKFATWVAGLPGKAKRVAQEIAQAFSGLANKAIAKAGSITAAIGRWASGVYGRARGVADSIVRAFSGLASRIINAIGTIVPRIKMPNIPRPTVTAIVKGIKGAASGGVFEGAQFRIIGEAGPEAVVPLNRSLAQVDPAVRALSAFAQGLTPPGQTAPASTGKTIDVGGITINTPTRDPRAVASEVIARMAAAAYI